jgi:hypothetical protein
MMRDLLEELNWDKFIVNLFQANQLDIISGNNKTISVV